MKTKSESRTKRLFTRIFNIRYWADWDRVKAYSSYLYRGAKSVFVPDPKAASETFAEAKFRLNLTDETLLKRQSALLRLSILMLGMAFLIFCYGVYHLFLANFIAFGLSMIIMTVALVLAIRYHFWYFQIKSKQLGCSFQQWFRVAIMGEKK